MPFLFVFLLETKIMEARCFSQAAFQSPFSRSLRVEKELQWCYQKGWLLFLFLVHCYVSPFTSFFGVERQFLLLISNFLISGSQVQEYVLEFNSLSK